MKYSIFDPTGNITALVESEVDISGQPRAAAEIMKLHGEVEQVGFVRFAPDSAGIPVSLRMAGGEFCGNASMCAAALYMYRQDPDAETPASEERTVMLRVSGAHAPVEVRLLRESVYSFRTAVRMPFAPEVRRIPFSCAGISGTLPVVILEGISHVIVEDSSPFFSLLKDRKAAGTAVKDWCEMTGSKGLGLMFAAKDACPAGNRFVLTPLVYIPGAGTCFWENSCASGTYAAGVYLAGSGKREYFFTEPGGVLSVKTDAETKETWLFGKAELRQLP